VVAAVKRQSPRKTAVVDSDGRRWMAGALIMASAYVLSTPPCAAAAASITADEDARMDAAASNETCRAQIPPGR
jgi:hypothetical protein